MPNQNSQLVHLQGATMGTIYDVKINPTNADQKIFDQLAEKIFHAITMVDNQMSTYKPQSDISRFNRAEPLVWVDVPEHMIRVAHTAMELAQKTNGAFDPAIFNIVDDWGFGPSCRKDINALLAPQPFRKISYHNDIELDLENRRMRKKVPTQIDFCGIAKGFGVDQICAVLTQFGIANYLVEIAGEVRCAGQPAPSQFWQIGLELPIPNQHVIYEKLSLKNKAVASSGYNRNFVQLNNINYCHIIDPHTGQPSRSDVLSATIIQDDCMRADALATACHVMGLQKAITFASHHQIPLLMLSKGPNGFLETSSESFVSLMTG